MEDEVARMEDEVCFPDILFRHIVDEKGIEIRGLDDKKADSLYLE